MNQIINYVSDFFGIIMRWCYVFVNNYGLSIIVFTIFTKFVLFPISLITQKNSIKMAQMRPELDAYYSGGIIQILRYWVTSRDSLSEELLVKQEKYKIFKK